MGKCKYQEIKEKFYDLKQKGIFYAFGDDQFIEGLRKEGYINEDETLEDFHKKGIKLMSDGMGGYGTKEAFDARQKLLESIDDEIRENCTAEEIFCYEWWNHESGLTYDYSAALSITRCYFPEFKVTQKLLNKLQRKFEQLNW